MKLSELQTKTDTELTRRDELYKQITEARQKGFAMADWLASVTPDTSIDTIALVESEAAAVARVLKTLDAAVSTANNDHQRAGTVFAYWQERAEQLAAEIQTMWREVKMIDREIVDAEERVNALARKKLNLITQINELEQKRGEIVTD